MANIKTLKDLTPGTVFDAGPIDVRVLDHMTNGTTLLIADKAVAWRPFSLEPMKTRPEEAPTPYPNDFSLSYLKDELNGPFLAAFDAAGGPIRSANIVTADWSLADHRGGFGYDAIRVCLKQQNTEELYSRWLFGLGEAPVSGSGEQSDAAAAPAQTSDEEKNTPQEPETTSECSEAPEENG